MLPSWYPEYVKKIEDSLQSCLKDLFKENGTPIIEEFKSIIFYGNNGGKRLRAILALEFYLVFSGKKIEELNTSDDIWKLCIAIEVFHAFSLIHDDLPCMDNDELRRGQPTVWKKYGLYNAVLAGDTMSIIAFEILSSIKNPEYSQQIIQILSHSLGIYGMIGGQVEDMYYETHTSELTLDILRGLHNKKTGKLIEACILSGIILGGGNKEMLDTYSQFGLDLGLAFQIQDDILDVEGTSEETGKSVGGEQKGFVYLLGIEKSKQELEKLLSSCRQKIHSLQSEKLDFIVDYVGTRRK